MSQTRSGLVHRTLFFVLALCVLAGCGGSSDSTAPKLVYQDQRIQFGLVSGSPLEQAIEDLGREWQQRTGAHVEIVRHTTEEVNRDAAAAFNRDDVLLYPSWVMGELAAAEILAPLPEHLLLDAEFAWDNVLPGVQRSCLWGGDMVAAPLGSPTLLCYFRRDLLKQLGVSPPQTWEEYFHIADGLRELSRSESGEGTAFAVAEPLGPEGRRAVFLARAAAYAKHPDNFSFLFNKRTMEPLIAEEGFVRALVDVLAARDRGLVGPEDQERIEAWIQGEDRNRYGDPAGTTYAGGTPLFNEATGQRMGRDEYVLRHHPELQPLLHYTVDDVRRALWEGRAALGLAWERAGVRMESDQSISIGVARLPGSAEVFQTTRNEWDATEGGTNRPSVLASSGLLLSVGRDTKHVEAALELVRFVCSNESRTPLVSRERDLVPYRETHFSQPAAWVGRGVGAALASQYCDAVRDALKTEDMVPPLRIPGTRRYLDALDAALDAALSGQAPPRDALEQAARQWEQITEELGRKRQRGHYERSLGLPTL